MIRIISVSPEDDRGPDVTLCPILLWSREQSQPQPPPRDSYTGDTTNHDYDLYSQGDI